MKERYSWTRVPATVLVMLLFLLPLVWLVLSSFKTPAGIFSYPPKLVPTPPSFDNYGNALRNGDFAAYFLNTVIVTATSTAISLATAMMAGFALAKYRFPGATVVFIVIMAVVMIPIQVILVPIFITLKNFGLINTLWGIIIPPAATPTGVFLMRQYFSTLPDELLEAARIDGAGDWRTLTSVVIPLSIPAVTAVTIFVLVWRWNDFLWPFLVINSQKLWTIQLALANYVGQYSIDWPSLLSMTVLALLPTLVIFVSLQRYFLQGLLAGGIKA